MERFYIYKLTFESGATYVGQHIQRKEKDNYITSSGYYKKHPEDKLLKREIIMDNLPDRERMDIFETICICQDKAENPKNVNYNLGQGKTYEERYGKEKAEEIKNKIKKSLTGNKRAKGKKLSEETKQKMSLAHKGKPHSEEWNKKVGVSQKGKPKSKEAIEKMKIAKLGKKLSEEHKKKISKAQIGSTYWNNGIICKRFKKGEEPGEGWVRGRLDIAWNKGLKLKKE